MSGASSVDIILRQARERENEYGWSVAAGLLQKALGSLSKVDLSREGEIHERLGYAWFRAGMQAENRSIFRERMNRAIGENEKAQESYRKSTESNKKARALRCEAMILYLGYWIASNVAQKKQLLDSCWKLTTESLQAFEEVGYDSECARTYNMLSISVRLRLFYALGFRARERLIKEAVEHGEKAVKFFLATTESNELVRAYIRTAAFLDAFAFCFPNSNERLRFSEKARDYRTKARELSEEKAVLEALYFLMEPHLGYSGGTEEALKASNRALEYCKRAGDKLITGWVLDWLAYHTFWKELAVPDKDEGLKLLNRALQYAEEARLQYFPLSFVSMRAGVIWTEAPNVEMRWKSAQCEANLGKKRELLETATKAAPALLKKAENSGYIGAMAYAYHIASKALASLARMETGSSKKRLLERALKLRTKVISTIERNSPYADWQLIVMHGYMSTLQSELAKSTRNAETRRRSLLEALSHVETSIRLCLRELRFSKEKGYVPQFATLGRCQHQYGDLLSSLHQLTNDEEHLRKAAESFKEAAESFNKANQIVEAAECNWRSARLYDALGEYLKAAENFEIASSNYRAASEEVAHFDNFYLGYASYMEAWIEIEKAKHHHLEQKHGLAKGHFEKAARVHKSLNQWSYLAPNYTAWAQVECAEDLSREERGLEAVEAFRRAAELFNEAREAIRRELGRINDPDEMEVASKIFDATDHRREYCLARIALEEAKTLEKEGEHSLSSEKYGLAADSFERIGQTLESDHDIRECRLIQTLSRAWQKMSQAEAEASPDLYAEASTLFKKAKDYSPNEKTKMLALGHSVFCRALRAGAKFADTREKTAHVAAMQYLNSATNYYANAGFGKASEYAKATGLLFDAYVHMDRAKTATDPEMKSRTFLVAERVLQASSQSYLKAGYPEKSRLVRRLFVGVRGERQVAQSLARVLNAPTISATTASFLTPTPTYETAVGFEKFEHAVFQVSMEAPQEVTVGKEFEARLDLVNVGREPGLLVRINDLIPMGFKAIVMPPQYKLDAGSLDANGKRLEPSKVETIKVLMEATKAEVYSLCPKVVYTDDAGKFQMCRPAAVQVTVQPPLSFEFKSSAAEKAFDYLIQSFVEDYMKRGVFMQEAGWRSLVQIIRNAGISHRSAYGDGGRRGLAVSELERRGLIDTRVFSGRRGRGGEVLKVRISYEKETVKRYVDMKVAKNR